MIELYLDENMRDKLLEYDIEHSENCYDRNMYYITNSESQILYDIIFGMIYNTDLLLEMGFRKEDIKIIEESDVNVKFTDKENYIIEESDVNVKFTDKENYYIKEIN